jgi:hypothetical protein
MTSVSVPGMYSCGNLHCLLVRGAFGPSPSQVAGLRAPFLLGRGIVGIADHIKLQQWTSLFFQRLVLRDFPIQSRFLVRPQSLTRI